LSSKSQDFKSRKLEHSFGPRQELIMATIIRGFSWVAPLAIVVSLSSQSSVLAQKGWNAEQLSRPFPERQSEKVLIETLRSGAPEEKAIACKQLSIYGSKEAVPELAKLLPDEQLSSWSRIALEAIDDPAADAALLEAAKSLHGQLLVGTINTLGVRRSAGAVDQLTKSLKDADAEVASASAVALGRIASDQATTVLQQSLASAPPAVRSAVAEGCILCAERLMADGKAKQAAELYDAVRKAQVPKQRMLEATRGSIVARGNDGVPLLVELLKSQDRRQFLLGLKTSRELTGAKVAEALAAELASAPPERAALLVTALGDRGGATLSPAVLRAASSGEKPVRLAAVEVVGRLGDATSVPVLLEAAVSDDADLSQAARAALAGLKGDKVNAELANRLAGAKGKPQIVLIDLVGERRMAVVPQLIKILHQKDESARDAALIALGATAGPKDVAILLAEVSSAKSEDDAKLSEKALHAACIRMPDREATATELAAALSKSSPATKATLLRILGAMGGPKALATIGDAVKTGDSDLQDVGTRVLGEWMTADAAPVLLEITKSSSADKYRVRALRGYLRIARQQKMPDAERLAMCREALAVAQRNEERELVLDALKRCPSAESVAMASAMIDDVKTRDRAVEVAVFIAEKIKDKDPAAAKNAAEKALKAAPESKFADRARALTSKP
jgi:HEAT repeat protein